MLGCSLCTRCIQNALICAKTEQGDNSHSLVRDHGHIIVFLPVIDSCSSLKVVTVLFSELKFALKKYNFTVLGNTPKNEKRISIQNPVFSC